MPELFPQYGHKQLFFIITLTSQLAELRPSVLGFPVQLIVAESGIQTSGLPYAEGTRSALSSTYILQASIICLLLFMH